MCGIVGYVGTRPVVDILIRGLKRLEYRGYDSTGVAFFHQGKLHIRKSEGKLENVEKLLNGETKMFGDSTSGLGHTRWATHGKPTTQNAHPHRVGQVVLVANGIIENYQEIKAEVLAKGLKPVSETDSELFGFLVKEKLDHGVKLPEAVRQSFTQIHGACSVVVMTDDDPGLVVGVRNGSPLVAATDPKGGSILASDAQPIIEYSRDVIFLEHGDMAVGDKDGIKVYDVATGSPIERPTTRIDWSAEKMDKQGYPHYMLKEIHEQPVALVDTLNSALDRAKTDAFPLAAQPGVEILNSAKEMNIVACGTSWHASMLGKYWLEKYGKIPVNVELASEFRYREPVVREGSIVVGVSQSGETADTLAVLTEMKKKGVPTVTITNVRGSTLSREANAVFHTSAGPEIGVAATKTYTTQMLMLLLWAGHLAVKNKHPGAQRLFDNLVKLPHLLESTLADDGEFVASVKSAARGLQRAKGFFFIGRGFSFPIALEGALKLKEIAYVHAEGYAAGELKHGPIAMIDEDMVVVVLAPRDHWRDKTVSNLEEVKARGAKIVGVGHKDDVSLKNLSDFWVPLPTQLEAGTELDEDLLPFIVTPVVQLFSYELAVLKGTDVDKPRNLAKSVTVE